MLDKSYSVERTNASMVPSMEASWLVSREESTAILYIQAQGHPELLQLLENIIAEEFIRVEKSE